MRMRRMWRGLEVLDRISISGTHTRCNHVDLNWMGVEHGGIHCVIGVTCIVYVAACMASSMYCLLVLG